MAKEFDKSEVIVSEVEVRLARPDEKCKWDKLMAKHHYLGFRQFAGRGMRYVVVWRGHWLGLLGWQSGAFKCAPRDRWLGWHRSVQFRRLHLISNNTRFLILPEAQGIANLASRALGCNLRRLSGDWESRYGHVLELAETFVDPTRFHGGAYDASNWIRVGRSKGFARSNGTYSAPHGRPKEMFVYPLHRQSRSRLSSPDDHAGWASRATAVKYTLGELGSLRSLFAQAPDCRRGQGRKHRLETVLSICLLARLAGLSGPAAAERFAGNLSQKELRALGAWRDPVAGRWVAPSDSTFCRVIADTDPDALSDVLRHWAAPRAGVSADIPALAADGKRIRGANRNTEEGVYFETVTLVTHDGRPIASRGCRDEGGELAATKALLEDVDVSGCLITLDALHTTYDTERSIVEGRGADYLFTVKSNCPETFDSLEALNWSAPGMRHYSESPQKGHGRLEQRHLAAFTLPKKMLKFGHARQAMRVIRERTELRSGKTSVETVYAITSVPAERADPEQLLAWNRGHWAVENANHYRRDTSLGEDASRLRARNAPANSATLNNIALAIVFHRGFKHVPEASVHFMMRREDAFDAISSVN